MESLFSIQITDMEYTQTSINMSRQRAHHHPIRYTLSHGETSISCLEHLNPSLALIVKYASVSRYIYLHSSEYSP